MRYLGGKNKLGKQIASFLESIREPGQVYLEPFVGGAWVLQEMSGDRVASDGCTPLITMYNALQSGWLPPEFITAEEYSRIKKLGDRYDPMTAFVGFGCSYSGKWFGGFAQSDTRNYCANAKNSLLKQLPKIKNVKFVYSNDYTEFRPTGMLIYCDPPYQDTTQYGYFNSFDHKRFWTTMRAWSILNTVVVSEYIAPNDFKCVLEMPTRTDMRVAGQQENRIERLFMYRKGE